MSSAQPKILLLDANALIHRSYHALPPLTNSKGEQVNAVYGFAAALLKAIKDEKPDYVVACFDVGRETFRNDIYPEYKAHRKESDEALYSQIPRVKQIVEVLNIPLFAQAQYEADDLIGSLSQIASKKGLQTVIVTGDNDALQLVNDSTSVYSLRRGVTDTLTYRRQDVKDKIGVYPEQIVDYKALAGDASDNIPGAPGIGPKTAVDLLNTYQDLDNLYQHLAELKDRPRQILIDNKKQVLMSKELATIKRDLAIDLDLKSAAVSNFDFSQVVTLFHELGFKSLLAKLPQSVTSNQSSLFGDSQDKNQEDKIVPQLPFEAITTATRWRQLKQLLLKASILVIDTETVDFGQELIGIAFAWNGDEAAYLPVTPYQGGLALAEVRDDLNEILGNAEIRKVGHNLKYDLAVLHQAGLEVQGIWFDTMIASQLANSQLFSHGLDALAFSELGFKKIPTAALLGHKKDGKMTDVPLETLAAYACEDGLITWRLFAKLRPELEAPGIKRVFYEIEMPLLPVLEKMEQLGIKIDQKHLAKLGDTMRAHLKSLESRIRQSAGQEFNVNSPSQLQEVLFTKLKLSLVGIKKIKSGYSTDADSLQKLRLAHPVVPLLLEYREMAKLFNTYVETLPKLADGDGAIHTSFQQIGAATGRLASVNPNLQNIPIRSELGQDVRRAFVARPGRVLLGADYSQAELRVLAHLSEDRDLIAAFHSGSDFHAAVAGQLGVDRRAAKAINFGIIYGLGSTALAADLGISSAEAKDFIDKYFQTFPGVAKFIEAKKAEARAQGYVETLFGRRRYLPDIHSPNMGLRSGAERMAVNMPCQGTVADLVKLAMIELDRTLNPADGRLLLQIHDELLLEVQPQELKKVAAETSRVMGGVAELRVPLEVGLKTGTNWADMSGLVE